MSRVLDSGRTIAAYWIGWPKNNRRLWTRDETIATGFFATVKLAFISRYRRFLVS